MRNTLLITLAVVLLHAAEAGADISIIDRWAINATPKYSNGFKVLDYTFPDAPRSGCLALGRNAKITNLNPFNRAKESTQLIRVISVESLMTSLPDDPLVQYPLLAERIELPTDMSSVTFVLRDTPRWHDGTPVTARDVVYSFNLLRQFGLEEDYQQPLRGVAEARAVDDKTVIFQFGGEIENIKEMVWNLGDMPILSSKEWHERSFNDPTLQPFVSSGPYKIMGINRRDDQGLELRFVRVTDYWGKDLPYAVGRFNYNEVVQIFYPYHTDMLEGFLNHDYDFRDESVIKNAHTIYRFDPYLKKQIVIENLAHHRTQGMQGFVMNLRRGVFEKRGVRKALALALDFDWMNRNLFSGEYIKATSFFNNSELAAQGRPSPEELKLLLPLKDKLPSEVFQESMGVNSESIEGNLQRSVESLLSEGYRYVNGRLISGEGKALEFELIIPYYKAYERMALKYISDLEELGIHAKLKQVSDEEFESRLRVFDYDMILYTFYQMESPGYEQLSYWTSEAAARVGSENKIGLSDQAVDILVDKLIAAKDRENLIVATHALDRALYWGYYIVPHWYSDHDKIVYWDKFERAKSPSDPTYRYDLFSWWIDAQKNSAIKPSRTCN